MLWDELELDHYTEAHLLAHSLSEAIADVATATSQLQQSLTHLDAMVKQQAAKAGAIRDDALVLQATSISGLAPGPQQMARGTTLTGRHGLLVRAGEQHAIVPFSQVQRIDYSGKLSSGRIYRLDALLGFHPASSPPVVEAPAELASPLLILREGTHRVDEEHGMGETKEIPETSSDEQVETMPSVQAIQVDEALGQVELHVKPLPPALQRPGIGGATINRAGEVVLALDLPALIRQYEWSRQAGEEMAALRGAQEAEHPTVARRSAERAPRILIVDDSVFIRRTLSQTLASQGYMLLEARDGIEALEQLTGAAPDVLLLDLEMPNLNGYELLNILTVRALLPDLKIILLTSRSSDKHQQRAKGLGIHAYLTKPCSEETLLETVAKVLERR
jgi:CheY-like chemotaxis protein